MRLIYSVWGDLILTIFASKQCRLSVLACTFFLTQGCDPVSPRRPDIVAASLPKPDTPSSVSGPLLDQCLADSVGKKYSGTLTDAKYDPSETLDFAEEMFQGNWRTYDYVERVRAYSVQPFVKRFFESRYIQIFCYYEISKDKLDYLTYRQTIRDAAQDEKSRTNAAILAAKKMAKG
jgi:hypothetical protein